MRKYLLHIILGLATLSLVAACGGGGGGGGSSSGVQTSKVTITVGDNIKVAKVSVNQSTLLASVKQLFAKLLPDSAIALIPSSVAKIKITITASDITTSIGDTFSVTPGGADLTATFDVPNGNNRVIAIEESDNAGHLVFSGSTTVNIDGKSASADVTVNTQNVTDMKTVVQDFMNSFAAALNKGAALTATDLDPFYATDTTFGMDSGWNRTQAINDMLKDPPTKVKKITSVTILSLTSLSGGAYQADIIANFDDGSTGYPDDPFIVVYENGALRFKGNGYKADVRITAEAHKWEDPYAFANYFTSYFGSLFIGGSTITKTGLNMEIKDRGNVGLQYARVQGPGLPGYVNASNQGTGVTFTRVSTPNSDNSLSLDSPDTTIPTDKWSFYPIADATILGMPDTNLTYTVTIMYANTSIAETRTIVLPKRPYAISGLGGSFPILTLINNHAPTSADNYIARTSIIGTTLTFSVNKPTVFAPTMLKANLNYWDNNYHSASNDKDLVLGSNPISGSITTTAPSGWTPTQGHLSIEARDSDTYRRLLIYHWMIEMF